MAAAGLYTFGGSFWEFGEPDWEHTRYFMLFGVAEDHASNPIKIGLGKLKAQGVKVVSVNPVRTGYGAIADEWIGIRPGTDGLFVGALIHELLRDRADRSRLSGALHQRALAGDPTIPGAADDGLFARDADGKPLALRQDHRRARRARRAPTSAPALVGHVHAGRRPRARVPVFAAARRALSRPTNTRPSTVAEATGDPGRHHPPHRRASWRTPPSSSRSRSTFPGPTAPAAATRRLIGRPVVDARHARHLGAFQRLPDLPHAAPPADPAGLDRLPRRLPLQGAVPAADAAAASRAGKPGDVQPSTPLPGAPLGFPHGPEDLLVDADGTPQRIDKAYSWDAPLAAHGLMHMVITNAAQRRSLPGRRAVHVHGQHELEFVDEHSGDAART